MENTHTAVDYNHTDINLQNIIAMNAFNMYHDEDEDDAKEYDLDNNPDDYFYEFQVI